MSAKSRRDGVARSLRRNKASDAEFRLKMAKKRAAAAAELADKLTAEGLVRIPMNGALALVIAELKLPIRRRQRTGVHWTQFSDRVDTARVRIDSEDWISAEDLKAAYTLYELKIEEGRRSMLWPYGLPMHDYSQSEAAIYAQMQTTYGGKKP